MRSEIAAAERERNAVADKRVDKGGGVTHLQHAITYRLGFVKNQRRGADRLHHRDPIRASLAESRMRL